MNIVVILVDIVPELRLYAAATAVCAVGGGIEWRRPLRRRRRRRRRRQCNPVRGNTHSEAK